MFVNQLLNKSVPDKYHVLSSKVNSNISKLTDSLSSVISEKINNNQIVFYIRQWVGERGINVLRIAFTNSTSNGPSPQDKTNECKKTFICN